MRLRYTIHARRRMALRGLSESDVEDVVAHPYRTARSRHTGDPIYFGRVGGDEIAVVVAAGSVPPRVVTVWSSRGDGT